MHEFLAERQRTDRAVLRHHLHLGYRRHHPDLQIFVTLGVDAKAAAKKYEEVFGVRELQGGGLTGFRPFGLRVYRLENPAQVGQTIAGFCKKNPEYRIVNVARGGEQLGAAPDLVLRKGDVIARGALIHIKGPARLSVSIGGR